MKEIHAELILASKNALTGDTLYTWVLTYPRIILAEVNTHRMASRNSASSRAIPQKKQRYNVLHDPFVPMSLGANQKGMQAGAEITGWRRTAIEAVWRGARYPQIAAQWTMEKLGAHKQVGNRLLEPWMWVETIFSATDVCNIFKLRNHKDAEPHFHELARQMQLTAGTAQYCFDHWDDRGPVDTGEAMGVVEDYLYRFSSLQVLNPGESHMPFISAEDRRERELAADKAGVLPERRDEVVKGWLQQISVARCARVSYYLHDTGKRSDYSRDFDLYNSLSHNGHWSPFEHVADAVGMSQYFGNFRGFQQHRKEFVNEGGER